MFRLSFTKEKEKDVRVVFARYANHAERLSYANVRHGDKSGVRSSSNSCPNRKSPVRDRTADASSIQASDRAKTPDKPSLKSLNN